MICKICQQDTEERSHFYKIHKIRESSYYAEYEPKFDILTGELIEFRNPESYYLSDVNNKLHLRTYLKEMVSREDGIKYLKDWLMRRKELKNLIYSPSEIELRTLPFPSVKFINTFYGENTYQNICKELGLINRYDYSKIFSPNREILPIITIDTREATPLDFSCEKIISKLNIGDYAPQPNPYSIFLERKSLQDGLSTFSGGFERFRNEMQRAQELKCNIIVIIETEFGNISSNQYLKKLRFTKVTADFIQKRVRDLLLEFPSVQVVCAKDRKTATKLVEDIFKLEYNPMVHDYQYLIDTKQINNE